MTFGSTISKTLANLSNYNSGANALYVYDACQVETSFYVYLKLNLVIVAIHTMRYHDDCTRFDIYTAVVHS